MQGRNGRDRGMAKGGNWFWVFSLSRSKTELSAFTLKKKKPPVAAAKSSIYRRRGSGDVAAHGEQGTPGEIYTQGAWGFKFWEQHAVINCFLFKGAWGSSSSVKTTLFNFFFFIIYLFFYLWGPKNGLQHLKSKNTTLLNES